MQVLNAIEQKNVSGAFILLDPPGWPNWTPVDQIDAAFIRRPYKYPTRLCS